MSKLPVSLALASMITMSGFAVNPSFEGYKRSKHKTKKRKNKRMIQKQSRKKNRK